MRGALAAALVLLVAAGLPAPAWAHANLERADPAPGSALDRPPRELHLSFSEAVDSNFSRVRLLNDRREQVDRGDSRVAANDPRSMLVSVPQGLPNGVYTVAWRTLSAVDGHTVDGAYPLIVGPVPAEAQVVSNITASSDEVFAPETAIGRWWFSLAASLLFGALLAFQVVLRPLFGRPNAVALQLAAERTRRLATLAATVVLVGAVYGALAQASVAAQNPPWGAFGSPLVHLLTQGRYAAVWWSRLAFVTMALGALRWRGATPWHRHIALFASGLALLTSSLNSHAAALLSGAYLGVLADWLHFLGVSAWLGGLASLAYVLPVAVRGSQSSGGRVLAQGVRRFSNLALVSVAVIVVTGTFEAWLEVGSWEGLIQTAYGLTITVKIALLVLALALAAFNLLIVRPRLAALAGKQSILAISVARRFALAVRVEIGLLTLILIAAAILTGLAPGREELARGAAGELQAGPVDRQVQPEGLSARIRISPASLGTNEFSVSLPAADANQVERVQLALTYLDAEFGSQPLVLDPSTAEPGVWEANSASLSQAGTWQAELLVRRTGEDDARTAIRFVVAGPGGVPQATAAGAAGYPLLPTPLVSTAYLLLAAGVVVLGAALVRVVRGGRRILAPSGALLATGVIVLGAGGYVYVQEQRHGVVMDVANVRDPVAPDERSLAIGRDIYTTRCETCHGETGRGDGPTGLRLVPRPADLRIHTAPGVHTDGDLFYWVSYGYPNSAMPAWRDQLSEEQRWDVINYARATFGNPANQTANSPVANSRP